MSIEWMCAVWKDSRIKNQGDLLVALAIADFCNEKGFAWPSIDTLAKKSRYSIRGVQRIIRSLEDTVVLKVHPQKTATDTNTYQLLRFNDGTGDNMAGGGANMTGGTGAKSGSELSPYPSLTVSSTDKGINKSCTVDGGTGGNHLSPLPKSHPSLEDMTSYGLTIALPQFEIERCRDHYEGNGWKVGKNPVKDWRAVMRNWKRGWQERGGGYAGNGHFKQPVNPNVPPPINGF